MSDVSLPSSDYQRYLQSSLTLPYYDRMCKKECSFIFNSPFADVKEILFLTEGQYLQTTLKLKRPGLTFVMQPAARLTFNAFSSPLSTALLSFQLKRALPRPHLQPLGTRPAINTQKNLRLSVYNHISNMSKLLQEIWAYQRFASIWLLILCPPTQALCVCDPSSVIS